MSASISSLLNPSPDADAATSSSPPPRGESLPSIQYVQSSEQPYVASPATTQPRHSFSYASGDEPARHPLGAFAGSYDPSAVAPQQPSWHAQNVQESVFDGRSSSLEQVRRPGSSGHGEAAIQLPPPSPTARKMSVNTLDQYHVPSRSPEQRRASVISPPAQADFTLPPIRTPVEQARTGDVAYGQEGTEQQHRRLEVDSHARISGLDGTSEKRQGASGALDPAAHEPVTSVLTQPLPYDNPRADTAHLPMASDEVGPSPTIIKEEGTTTPSTPVEASHLSTQNSDLQAQSLKTVASLKNEHGLRTQSPLRESSMPVPSTEITVPEPSTSKKRPAPSKTKKGMATATKKPPAAKKRKVEPKPRSTTPLSQRAPKGPAFKGTPVNSSPAAPSTRSQSVEPDDEQYDEDEEMDDGDGDGDGDDNDVYCICRKPDNGTFMIGCDGRCDDWFHGKCVGIEERDKNLIDKYMCPNCERAGHGRTTWKRMCRRAGCRQPAKVTASKSKNGKEGSKYCSDECGVLFFREMVARTRGREDMGRQHGTRRKNSLTSSFDYRAAIAEQDLGARGGALAAGELKGLITPSKTASDFQKLGDGVLSPPATPDSAKQPKPEGDDGDEFTAFETTALEDVRRGKEESRRKHALLKDRMKFVTLAKQAASRRAAERELKPKEFCGYDSRIEWTEARFGRWRASKVGTRAFELETLDDAEDAAEDGGDVNMKDAVDQGEEEMTEFEVCDRKKCARHLEWGKLAVDDVRFEMADNSDRMRALEREERGLRERAALRRRGAGGMSGEGSVTVHEEDVIPANGEVGNGNVEVVPSVEGETPTAPGEVAIESTVIDPVA